MGARSLGKLHGFRLDERASAAGLNGSGAQWVSLTDGRFAEHVNLPPVVQDDGFDGRVDWNRDATGLVWDDGSDSGRSSEIDAAYVATYRLWTPYFGGASVRATGDNTLSVLPRGSKIPIDMTFDSRTHLLTKSVITIAPVVSTTTYGDYHRVHGLMVPFDIVSQGSDGNGGSTKVANVTFDAADVAANVVRPSTAPHDYGMQNGASATTIPVELVENHVYLNVKLNGKPYRFIFDTGGQNVLDSDVAKELGAQSNGSFQGSGVGAQTESASFTVIKSLEVGDAVLHDQLFATAPVHQGFGVAGGQPADGIIGWEVLARFVTTFDYANKTVTLTTATTSIPGGDVVPFVFAGTQPQIPCKIDGIASQCTIDTGARDSLSFYGPYLAAHPSVVPATLTAPAVTGFGFGGPAIGKLGRIGSLTIGQTTMNDLVASVPAMSGGALARPFEAANIGGSTLKRFTVTFDYRHETMTIVPNRNVAQQDEYERSGLFLIRQKGTVVVASALASAPAAEAGIVKGDALVSVDGQDVAAMSLEQIRAAFMRPAGTVVRVGVKSSTGAERTIAVTLRDYV